MKIINDTIYSKGNPVIDFGYYDPRTRQPYSSLQNASQYLQQQFDTIPIGLTICVNENELVEYWWTGTKWEIKNFGLKKEDVISLIPDQEKPDFQPVYDAIANGDNALREEINDIVGDLNDLKTIPAEIDNIESRVINNEDAINSMNERISSIEEEGGQSHDQDPIEQIDFKFLTIYGTDNAIPTGGSYDFSTKKLTPPVGWYTYIPETDQTIYFCYGTIQSNQSVIEWQTPIPFITENSQINIPISKTYPMQIYASSSQPLPRKEDILFDIENKTIIISENSIWRKSPSSLENPNSNVWVSYNNYIVINESNYTETGWSTPQLFINVENILDAARNEADNISQQNLSNAQSSITDAINNANNKIEELDNLKTQLQTDINSAIDVANDVTTSANDLLQTAAADLDRAREMIASIQNGEINVGGLYQEISELKGQIKNYGWSSDVEITNYQWKLDGVVQSNFPNLEREGKLMLNDIHNINGIYFILDRFGSGQYKLYKTDSSGVKELNNDSYITITYDNGNFVPNSESVTSVLICEGTPSIEKINYADSIMSAAEGRILNSIKEVNSEASTVKEAIQEITANDITNKVDSAVLLNNGTSQLNQTIATQSATTINQMVWGSNTNPNGNQLISTSIINQAKDYIDQKVLEVDNGELNQTSIHMSPEQIVLSAIDSNNVECVIYSAKNGTKLGVIGNTYNLLEENGKKYIYSGTLENPTYYVVSNNKLSETSEKTQFNGYLKYEVKNGNTASEALQKIASDEITTKIWGNNDQSNGELWSVAIQRLTKDSITNEVTSQSGGTFKNAITSLTNSLIDNKISQIENGEFQMTQMRMSPKEILLSAVESNNIEYYLFDEKDGVRLNSNIHYYGNEYRWTTQDDIDYIYQIQSGLYLYYDKNENKIKQSEIKVPFEGYIEFYADENIDVIKGSFINVIKDQISLNVNSSGNKATISLTANENGSSVNIDSDILTVTGNMIAEAISSESVNVNNVTYLNSDGSVSFGKSTTYFDKFGFGYTAGGLISWGDSRLIVYSNNSKTNAILTVKVQVTDNNISSPVSVSLNINGTFNSYLLGKDTNGFYLYRQPGNGSTYYAYYDNSKWNEDASASHKYLSAVYYEGSTLQVQGMINATGGQIGGWTIGNGYLNAKDTNNNYITLMPSAIYSGNISPTNNNHNLIGWGLCNDGTGWFAKNKIFWDTNGYGNINNQLIWTNNKTVLKSPTIDYKYVQLEGVVDEIDNVQTPILRMGTYANNQNTKYQLTFLPNKIIMGANQNAQLWIDDSENGVISLKGANSYATFNNYGILFKNIDGSNSGAQLAIGSNTSKEYSSSGLTSSSNSLFIQSVSNSIVQSFLIVDPDGIRTSSVDGGQINVNKNGVSINTGPGSTSTPYIVINNNNVTSNPNSIGIYSKSRGNRINITSTNIQLLAGSSASTKSIQVIDSDGIRLYSGATETSNVWKSNVSQNISNKGIGLFAEYKKSSTNYNDTMSALVVTSGNVSSSASNSNDKTSANNERISAIINSKVSSSGRVALASAVLDGTGYVTGLNAFLSVSQDGIYAGGDNFIFGSNNRSKLYIQDDQRASIVIGNVASKSNPGGSNSDNFIAFYNDDGKIQIKGSKVEIDADVKIYAPVTAKELFISDYTSSISNYAGITGEAMSANSSKLNTDKIIWSGGSRTGDPTFYVTREGSIYAKEGIMNIINNNHVTDYRNENFLINSNGTIKFVEFAGFKLYGKQDNNSQIKNLIERSDLNIDMPIYVLDPSKLGDVVYLPDFGANGQNNLPTTTSGTITSTPTDKSQYTNYVIILPFGFSSNELYECSTNYSTLIECIGRKITLINTHPTRNIIFISPNNYLKSSIITDGVNLVESLGELRYNGGGIGENGIINNASYSPSTSSLEVINEREAYLDFSGTNHDNTISIVTIAIKMSAYQGYPFIYTELNREINPVSVHPTTTYTLVN